MSKIRLYHGTTAYFDTVDLNRSKSRKDFGKGFYLTSDLNQAIQFAQRRMRSDGTSVGYVYMWLFDEEDLKVLNKHKFNGASIAWLDYILTNRTGKRFSNLIDNRYDIVIGKVADAYTQKILTNALAKYGDNLSDTQKKEIIMALKPDNLIDQYCFKTNTAPTFLNNKEFKRRVIKGY